MLSLINSLENTVLLESNCQALITDRNTDGNTDTSTDRNTDGNTDRSTDADTHNQMDTHLHTQTDTNFPVLTLEQESPE